MSVEIGDFVYEIGYPTFSGVVSRVNNLWGTVYIESFGAMHRSKAIKCRGISKIIAHCDVCNSTFSSQLPTTSKKPEYIRKKWGRFIRCCYATPDIVITERLTK